MNEQEWMASNDPRKMLEQMMDRTVSGRRRLTDRISDRKLRMFARACCELAGLQREAAEYIAVGKEGDWERSYQWAHNWSLGDRPDLSARASLLRCIVGNPFRPVTLPEGSGTRCPLCKGERVRKVRPVGASSRKKFTVSCQSCRGKGVVPGPCPWLTHNDGAVVKIAQSIYEFSAWDELPVLRDALIEAGCEEETILSHCLEPIHARGCWVLDLLLGRE